MPLIECPDCSRQVSDSAATCPGCGYPIAQGKNLAYPQHIAPATTIEQTGKNWKKRKLAAGLMIVVGLIMCGSVPQLGVLLMLAGIGTAIYAGFGSWWHHA